MTESAEGNALEVVKGPSHAVESAQRFVCKHLECGGREVKIPLLATHAAIGDGDLDGLALPYTQSATRL